jgi:hypothetical protein
VRKGGPGFVLIGRSALGGYKVLERWPLSEDGWQRAWAALSSADPGSAQQMASVLAERVGRARLAQQSRPTASPAEAAALRELNALSLGILGEVALLGGYGPPGERAAHPQGIRAVEGQGPRLDPSGKLSL